MNTNPFEVLEQKIDKRLDKIEAGILQLTKKPGPEKILSEKYLTVDQVCELLSVTRTTLWSWDRKGILESCRIGNQRAYEILQRISKGKGTEKDLDDLNWISKNLYVMSNCGLGQTAGTPIHDILHHFRAEVEAHVRLGVCPAGVCPMN